MSKEILSSLENSNNLLNLYSSSIKYHDIVPLVNPTGKKNCFLNAIVQILYHSELFRRKLSKIQFKQNGEIKKNNPIYQLINLFQDYNNCQYQQKKYTLDIKFFRAALTKNFKDIIDGESGDPVEVLNKIFNSIHLLDSGQKLNNENPSSFKCNNCISHELFSMKIKDRIYCSKCNNGKYTFFDLNYFIYEILIFEILEQIHNQRCDSYRNELFYYSKLVINNFLIEEKMKIDNCKCENQKLYREIIQYNEVQKPYLIINLTWDKPKPKMTNVCKIFNLIPLLDYNGRLFEFEENNHLNTIYYLYAIILFYNNHYTCAINIKNCWYFIDDDKSKKFDSYKDLVFYLIKNYYYPIVLFYSIDNISYDLDRDQVFYSDDFKTIYNECYEIDKRNGENVNIYKSTIIPLENSNIKKSNNFCLFNNNDMIWYCNFCKNKNQSNSSTCWCCKRNIFKVEKSNYKNSFVLFKENFTENDEKIVSNKEIEIKDENIGNMYLDSKKISKNENEPFNKQENNILRSSTYPFTTTKNNQINTYKSNK
jgi:hypothetical protein